MDDLTGLFARVAASLPKDAWCTLDKAQTLASIVVALRPRLVVEIGVWRGDSLIPQLLALAHVGSGRAVAIDPWSPEASVEGQVDQRNVEWWGRADHEVALSRFVDRMARHEVGEICRVVRAKSDDVDPADLGDEIDVLHVDANHGDNAIRDVERFAVRVPIGGVLVMDDLEWSGGSVRRAHDSAERMGFCDLYLLGTGCVMRRRSKP